VAPVASVTPVTSGREQEKTTALAELDEKLAGGGLLLVEVPTAARDAWMAHVERRLRAMYREVFLARAGVASPVWSRLAAQLGGTLDADARRLARTVITLLAKRRGAIVAAVGTSSWDRAVTAEVARIARVERPARGETVRESDGDGESQRDLREAAAGATDTSGVAGVTTAPVVLFVTDAGEIGLDAERWTAPLALAREDLAVWFAAWSSEATQRARTHDLSDLEAWARTMPAVEAAPAHAPDEARLHAMAVVSLFGGLATRAALQTIGVDAATIEQALAKGALTEADADLSVAAGWQTRASDAARAVDEATLVLVAQALEARDPGPWAKAHAAALLLRAGRADDADRLFGAAVTSAFDPAARRELAEHWGHEIGRRPDEEKHRLFVQAAERALGLGEADEALRWARQATSLASAAQSPRAALLLGRASVATGDLVAARATLRRSLGESLTDAAAAEEIAVELADVDYLSGELDGAERTATVLAGRASSINVRLRASNVLGKLLLARAQWDAADRHFAEDALAASAARDATAEMRARLNRGIARLSKGSLDEAQVLFQGVLDDAERQGDLRASAFALDNLAVVAGWRRDYARALDLSERTLDLRQRLGDRLTTARILANLAELRRRLGNWEHASLAIAFGRRLLGPGMPPARASHFAVVAARVALARGESLEARKEIAAAIRDGEAAGDREFLGEVHRVTARVALEEGNVARAARALDDAEVHGTTPEATAEAKVLRARLGRARGDDAETVEAVAREAVSLSRDAGDEELVVEALVLLARCAVLRDDLGAASSHLAAARDLLIRVGATLPGGLRDIYLRARLTPDLGDDAATAPLSVTPPPPSLAPGSLGAVPGSTPPASVNGASFGATSTSGAQAQTTRELIGETPVMRTLVGAIVKVARSRSTVLVYGESGTGKELVAEALHRASERASGPLVVVNCAALVETLLLSELFGHEKGAFTGAVSRRRGRFELASGGTLFLDEIGDISARTQVALLRVLQESTFERVGGVVPIRVDTRVVCATHRNLRAMVERGEFREDLYYRLRGITLEVPPLRVRLPDIPRIADNLLRRIAGERNEPMKTLSSSALDLLQRHLWPGNVRELENALRVASLFADGLMITAEDLAANVDDLGLVVAQPSPGPQSVPRAPGTGSGSYAAVSIPPSTVTVIPSGSSGDLPLPVDGDEDDAPLPATEADATAVAYAQVRGAGRSLADVKRQIERDCIARALAETRGNITRAAQLLGMKRPRLSQLVKQYGLSSTEAL
jgi:transcriptional regulator with GAF, ATPase, and Fis domain/tetratricopeptide (TPR) repeat protein